MLYNFTLFFNKQKKRKNYVNRNIISDLFDNQIINNNINFYLIKIYKRNMFMKGGNSIVLKKSGEVMINTKKDSAFTSPISSPRLGLDSLTLNTKNIDYVSKYAQYTKLIKNEFSITEWRDCIAEFNFGGRISFLKSECNLLLERQEATPFQVLVFLKRLDSLKLAFAHTVVVEKLEEKEGYVTFMYNVITTSPKKVDLGGPNKFKPLYLCSNSEGKNFYTIPLTYYNKVTADEYLRLTQTQLKINKIDSVELQHLIVNNIIRLEKKYAFYAFDIKKQCVEMIIIDINPNEQFLLKNKEHLFTGLVIHNT